MSRPLLAAVLGLTLSTTAAAAPHRAGGYTGIGLGGGTSTSGISAKHFLNDRNAVQGVVGAWGGWSGTLGLSGDYLYEMPPLATGEALTVAWNVGPGVGLGLIPQTDQVALAGNAVVGLELAVVPFPMDVVLEYRPTVQVIPNVAFDPIAFTGHIRFFFGGGQARSANQQGRW